MQWRIQIKCVSTLILSTKQQTFKIKNSLPTKNFLFTKNVSQNFDCVFENFKKRTPHALPYPSGLKRAENVFCYSCENVNAWVLRFSSGHLSPALGPSRRQGNQGCALFQIKLFFIHSASQISCSLYTRWVAKNISDALWAETESVACFTPCVYVWTPAVRSFRFFTAFGSSQNDKRKKISCSLYTRWVAKNISDALWAETASVARFTPV